MIATDRLVLRRWAERDIPALRAQCADAEVMRYLLPVADEAAFRATLDRWQDDHGFTFWVAARRADGACLGLCGLKRGLAGTPVEGRVEIGWRFTPQVWGHGYAREAAEAVLGWAWCNTPADEVVAITVPANRASWGLMERLGMRRDAGADFDHPAVAEDSPFKRHIVYRLARPA